MCGLAVDLEGQQIVGIRGDTEDHFSRGHLCPKAVALQDLHTDPDRLRTPVKRVGDRWEPIGWDEAFALVTDGIRRVQRTHGLDAVATYLGNPTVHSLGGALFAPGLTKALGTKNRYSATSVDQLPHHLAALWMFGHPLLIPIPDLDRTDLLVIFGANPAASNGSLMTAPDVSKRLKEIRARGGRVLLFDPRRTETAALADAHHFIRPGTDALALAAMVHTVLAEGLAKPGRVGAFTDGLEALRAAVAPFTPESVEERCGVAAETLRAVAREIAAAPRAAVYGRVGVSMQEYGGLACWLITALNVITGHCDEPGGVMFTNPAIDILQGGGSYGGRGRFARWKSRVRGLPEFAGELPVAALAEEMETPGRGQVRALITHAGNPVLSTPNGARLDRAIAQLDFYVAIDFYVNATTRHAHVILPPTAGLERDQYDLVFHALAIRNTAKFSPAILTPSPGARPDWQILNTLTARLTTGSWWRRARAKAQAFVLGRLGVRGMIAKALQRGPYAREGLTLDRLLAAPHGVDLGALTPMLPARLRTESGRIDLAPSALVADLGRLATSVAAAPETLALIGRRALRSNNSWMHNSERLVRGADRCTLLMHPDDAASRSIADGSEVRVRSRTGEVVAPVEITDAMMPGVVSLPHGWGHARPGVQLRVATAHAGVSINDLTDDQRVDALTGNAAFSGVRVEVGRV
ncbi:MAG: molybdopterin oxidoreductase family protein [Gemmatimonadaceae bacterium]|nr:molybdopterin oxidoreductase family protein [Gemmatimonadaceae bacterium]